MSNPHNQNPELFELCKQVFEATGWRSDDQWFLTNVNEPDDVIGKARPEILTIDREYEKGYRTDTPLYTSDYLSQKLQSIFPNVVLHIASSGPATKLPTWIAQFRYNMGMVEGGSDTPLKALLKLTIALHEAGELK